MNDRQVAMWLLQQEARALLTRLARIKPYALHMPMVPAAAISPLAQTAIETHTARGRQRLRRTINRFLRWLTGPAGALATAEEAQRRFTLVRLHFNAIVSQFDIFADVLAQRSDQQTGVWVAGLDDVAADALALPGGYFTPPPVVCYLDRGHGAAIRRARTRLPGGEPSPIAVVTIPRERLVGGAVGASLCHEVGHQGAALLDLVRSLQPLCHKKALTTSGAVRRSWLLWRRWASECLGDFWCVARLGIASALGLIGVVSLPRAFVFRLDPEDPHPFPFIRVKASCAFGAALFPHPQWERLARVWEAFYPRKGLGPEARRLLEALEVTLPSFVHLLIGHRPPRLRGRTLGEAMGVSDRQPARLAALFACWGADVERLRDVAPTLALAVLGQARMDGRMTPEEESDVLANLLTYWAARSALDMSAVCAARPMPRRLMVGHDYAIGA